MNKTAELMPHNCQHFHLSQIQNSKRLNGMFWFLFCAIQPKRNTDTRFDRIKSENYRDFGSYTSTHSMRVCFMWCFKSQKHAQLQSDNMKRKNLTSQFYIDDDERNVTDLIKVP